MDSQGARRSTRGRRRDTTLFLDVTAVDLNDMPLAALELDAEIDSRSRKREIAVLAHRAFDQHATRRIDDAHRDAHSRAAVAEPTFARDSYNFV